MSRDSRKFGASTVAARNCVALVRLDYSIVPRSYRDCPCVTASDTLTNFGNVRIRRTNREPNDKPTFFMLEETVQTLSLKKPAHNLPSQKKPLSTIMELPTFSAMADFSTPDHYTSCGLTSPDPESRGRKRRRDPISFTFTRPDHSPSAESCTFRGRSRHRSSSRLTVLSSRASSRARHTSPSPSKRRLLGIIVIRPENRRRSQSPSRSRSPGAPEMATAAASKRRRQRTRSRSRPHGRDGTFSLVGQSQKAPFGLVYLRAQDDVKGME